MTDTKGSALTELTVLPAVDDLLELIDVSDSTMAGSGTNKKVKWQLVEQAIARAASAADGPPPTGVTYQNFGRYSESLGNLAGALVAGTLKMFGIWLPAGAVIANISAMSATTALTTSGSGPHSWAALYDSSRNLLRQSTDVTNDTWAANTLKTWTLSSTFTTTYTGFHYLGLMIHCGSTGTMPSLTGTAGVTSVLQGLAPVLVGASSTGQGATAPNPAAAITVAANHPWIGCA